MPESATGHDGQLLTQLERAMHQVSRRRCPCGHVAEEHNDGGCPCAGCDLRTFEVEQGSVFYADTGQRLSLTDHLAKVGGTP